MARTSGTGKVIENAEYRINREVFNQNHEDIFGKPKSQFCEKCDKRLSWCECPKEENKEDKDATP